MTRVVITKTGNGYAVRSYDFTDNVNQQFQGKRALRMAVLFAQTQGYEILNFKSRHGFMPEELAQLEAAE